MADASSVEGGMAGMAYSAVTMKTWNRHYEAYVAGYGACDTFHALPFFKNKAEAVAHAVKLDLKKELGVSWSMSTGPGTKIFRQEKLGSEPFHLRKNIMLLGLRVDYQQALKAGIIKLPKQQGLEFTLACFCMDDLLMWQIDAKWQFQEIYMQVVLGEMAALADKRWNFYMLTESELVSMPMVKEVLSKNLLTKRVVMSDDQVPLFCDVASAAMMAFYLSKGKTCSVPLQKVALDSLDQVCFRYIDGRQSPVEFWLAHQSDLPEMAHGKAEVCFHVLNTKTHLDVLEDRNQNSKLHYMRQIDAQIAEQHEKLEQLKDQKRKLEGMGSSEKKAKTAGADSDKIQAKDQVEETTCDSQASASN